MDLHPTLKRAARRIAAALHEYAAARGWKFARWQDWSEGDYAIRITVNEAWPRFEVQFVAKAFAHGDRYDAFNSVRFWIESKLADEPQVVNAITLYILSPEEFERYFGGSSHNVDEIDVDDELIASAIPSTGPSSPTP